MEPFTRASATICCTHCMKGLSTFSAVDSMRLNFRQKSCGNWTPNCWPSDAKGWLNTSKENEFRGRENKVSVTDWIGNLWKLGSATPAAHPNSRFCAPAKQCPITHPDLESPKGIPIDVIIFGVRRPQSVPLLFRRCLSTQPSDTSLRLKELANAFTRLLKKNVALSFLLIVVVSSVAGFSIGYAGAATIYSFINLPISSRP